MPRLRRVARMCSRTVSGTAYRFRHGSTLCSPTVEKILCRSPISKRSHVGNLRQIRKQGKGRSSKRKGNRRCPFLFASRRPQTANPPLRFSGKHPARQGRTRLRQFAYPAGSVQEKVPPGLGEHACAVRVSRLTLRSYLTILRRQSMLSQQQNRRKYEPVHPCTLRSVPRH